MAYSDRDFAYEQALDRVRLGRAHDDESSYGHEDEARDVDTPDRLVVKRYADFTERTTSWLWYPYLPSQALVSLEGNPGDGKSWIALAIAASVSTGHWPFTFSDGRSMHEQQDRDLSEPGVVLHVNIEDDPEETIVKRLRILGADQSRIFNISGVVHPDKGNALLHFTVDQIPVLEASVNEHQARLVILDPIQAYLPRGTDMNKAESMRPVLDGLVQMARRTGCTVLIVRH